MIAVLMLCAAGPGSARANGVTQLPSMASNHYGGAMAALSDGRVLVAGGNAAGGQASGAELYDPVTQTWSTVTAPDGGENVWNTALAALPGDQALLAGGVGDGAIGSASNLAEIYDAASNTWTATTPMGTGRNLPVAASLGDGRVLVAGGFDAQGNALASAEIYDPATKTWTATPSLPLTFPAAAVALPDGRVMLLGGHTASGGFGLSAFYNPGTNAWTLGPTAQMGTVAAAPLPDGRVAVLTGATPYADEIYEPLTDSFELQADLPGTGTATMAAPLPGGHVLVAGGYGDANGLTTLPTARAEDWSPPLRQNGYIMLRPALSGPIVIGGSVQANVPQTGPDATTTIQWQRCAATCVNVGAPVSASYYANWPSYSITNADIGAEIQYVVTVAADGQSISATSAPSSVVAAPGYAIATPAGQAVDLGGGLGQIAVSRNFGMTFGSVHYELTFPTAGSEQVYPPITGTVSFGLTQTGAAINFPTTDAGLPLLAQNVVVTLSAPSGGAISGPSQATFPISPSSASASFSRSAGDPLGLVTPPPASDPLTGASFFVDPTSIAARDASVLASSDATAAGLLHGIASQPGVTRFGAWNGPHPGIAVRNFLARVDAIEPSSVPMLSTYRIVDGQCHHGDDTSADAAAYHAWITSLAEGIGAHPAVMFLEMDSLITTPCLNRSGLAIRLGELRDAVAVLSNCPHLVVYLDAGAADALPASRAATLLRQAGVAGTEGFFLNSTHFDWTRKEIVYGERISRLTGGKHFVINTAENGRGPLLPKHRATEGNEILCDPAGRGLGPLPTAATGVANLDAYAWIANPGVSGGQCRPGAPRTGVFWPALAIELARNADFQIT